VLVLREVVKILILDDSPNDIKTISDFLYENGYTIPPLVAQDEESFRKKLNEFCPDVIISEHELPMFNSLQAFNMAKNICPDIIFILLSNKISDEFGFELLKEGIDAYFIKDRGLQLTAAVEALYLKRQYNIESKKLIETNRELNNAYKIIEAKNRNIVQSIVFAKRIQTLTLPKTDILLKNFQEAFILYKPKDIVSGDFYWFNNGNGFGRFMIAVGDCTGHGVSGALLSMIGYNLLNEIVNDADNLMEPAEIMFQLDNGICKLLKQDANCGYQDGIDMSFVSIDKRNKRIYFCGCKRPLLYLVRDEKKIIVYKGDPYLVGGIDSRVTKTFKTQEIDYKTNDTIYMLSDGYTDQFGGDNNKKLMKDKFAEILLSIQHLNLNYQSQLLEQKLIKWQGDQEQTDDVLVVGIKL
jgi:serine phosphatase RsbU (regulator of sigma subunit)